MKLKILSLTIFSALVVYYLMPSPHFPFAPYIDTIFADGFSWEKFEEVQLDMDEDEIESILGEPIDKYNYGITKSDHICWRYSTDGKLWPYADFSYYLVQVCFDNGKVTSKPIFEFGN